MREDFKIGRERLEEIGIRRIVEEHYMTPQRHGTIYFVKSPASPDKTASLAIFPETNRFCDFAMVIKAETSSRCTHMLRVVVSGKL